MDALRLWLHVATADLPPEVVARVRAESAGHVQDAVEAGEPEALAVQALGDPERVHRELHRLYLNDARLRALRQDLPWWSVVPAWGMPAVYGFFTARLELFFPVGSISGWRLIAPALHTLEAEGLIESEEQEVGGRVRREYRLTEKGRGALARGRGEWERQMRAVGAVLGGKA